MKRLFTMLICLILGAAAMAQRPGRTPVTTPTLLSVADIAGNYGLDTAWINDTAGVVRYLDEQPQDYVELTNFCVSVRTKAQKMISSLENDYPFRDSLIWIDSNTVISDYSVYEFRLRRLADLMGKMSIKYSRLEQQRIEAEKEATRLRAIEEARRQQEERNRIASDLRSNIELHHRAIITACDGAGISDKAKLKELKDLYYSYLMVYNKYDLSAGNATTESINRLDELNAFQNDLLENVLGQNSLPYQIENFKNVLKVRCEKDNGDVYRSYSKVFKHTSVPVSFADVKEYEEYLNRMRTVINVQQRYLQTLDLRATINAGTDAINTQYGKKYKQVLSSYRDVCRGLNTLPSFTTNAESILFIEGLEDFVSAQQRYLDFFSEMEEITTRGDTIKSRGVNRGRVLYDVVVAYRDIEGSLMPVPSFSTTEGADLYEEQLEEVRKVQQCYLEVLDLRERIASNDDSITNAKKLDRTLANGYKLLRRQVDLRPSFSTVERGRSFIEVLRSYIELQQLSLATMHKLEHIKANAQNITSKDSPYRNIGKAYNRMEKAYQGVDEITNTEDLRRYSRQCDYVLEMQEAFLNLLRSQTVAEADARLKKDSGSVDKIKLIIGLD